MFLKNALQMQNSLSLVTNEGQRGYGYILFSFNNLGNTI